MSEHSKPTRRRIVQGAAWAVPVIAVGAPVPALAASPPNEPPCSPEFTLIPEQSAKCCDGGPVKNMLVTFTAEQTTSCPSVPEGTVITVIAVWVQNAEEATKVVLDQPIIVGSGESVTAYLSDVPNCSVNIVVQWLPVGTEVPALGFLKSDNIPQGNRTAGGLCEPA